MQDEERQPIIRFIIPGEPIATARAGRHFNPKTGMSHSFTPEKTRNFKVMVKTAFQLAYPNFIPLTGPVEIRLSIFMPARLSMTKGEKAIVEADEKALPHSKKPDGKNIRWGLEDALESLAFVNDSQVSRYRDEKTYSFRPRTEVEIYEIPVPETRRPKIILPKATKPEAAMAQPGGPAWSSLFVGEAAPPPAAPKKGHADKPGSGPIGETCGTCNDYRSVEYNRKRYPKCRQTFETWSHGPGTDIKKRDPACSRWTPQGEDFKEKGKINE